MSYIVCEPFEQSTSHQLYEYHQSSMATDQPEPGLSSFQRWKLEDDIKFYATFPQARPAANQYTFQTTQYGDYFGGAGFGFNLGRSFATDKTITGHLSDDHYSSTNNQTAPAHNRGEEAKSSLSPTLHHDYDPVPDDSRISPSSSHTYRPLILYDSLIHRNSHNHVPPTQPGVSVLASQPYHTHAPVDESQSHMIVPAQQPCSTHQHHSKRPEPPIMDYLPSPSSPTPPSRMPLTHRASFDAPHAVPSDQWRLPDQVDTPWQYEPLPQSSVTRAVNPPFSSRPLHAPQRAFHRSTSSQSYSHLPPNRHSIQPLGWSMVRTPSPRIHLSPLAQKRQLEKKPPLACLFCRGRKIACGPPDPGSLDPTCNQCQRRSIKCEYPSESRRGMRRKKSAGGPNTTGPKMKLGKRSRSNG